MQITELAQQPPKNGDPGGAPRARTLPTPHRHAALGLLHALFLLSITLTRMHADSVDESKRVADLSLEELMNEPVTSVSKKETRLGNAATAISVISPDEIRRNGHTTIAESLRMVPGLNVARIDQHQWAISSRGFNDQYANKLLVMIDGRTVYSPTFAGVYWDAQNPILEDLERIEVIRGPGATLWGANAVNGVINIITRSAKETQGTLLSTGFGSVDRNVSSARYGGVLSSNLYYRVYGSFTDREGFDRLDRIESADDWKLYRGGLRLDQYLSDERRLTFQGDYYAGSFRGAERVPILVAPYYIDVNENHRYSGGNALTRFTHPLSEDSKLTIQAFYDRTQRSYLGVNELRDTGSLDMQQQFKLGESHEFLTGIEYRITKDRFLMDSGRSSFNPAGLTDHLVGAFLQDEITLIDDQLRLTVGSKIEHNDYSGVEIQPGAQLIWTPSLHQSLWISVSRAVRSPSRYERDGRIHVRAFPSGIGPTPTVLASVVGRDGYDSENLLAHEFGYRIEPSARLSIDVAAFLNLYDDLRILQDLDPIAQSNPPHLLAPISPLNTQRAETFGVEAAAVWHVTDSWKWTAGYTWLRMNIRPVDSEEGDSPQHQVHVRTSYDLTQDLELSGALYYVDQVPNQPAPPYFRLDLGVSWQPWRGVELSLHGHNLLDNRHPEFNSFSSPSRVEIPRSVFGRLTVKF
ncbi:MAG: TonB-dependent receptor [Verrucomicrobiales bacterium]|nr:TonB-dependent receptor [Verrucomicrobiales bacterium]